MWLARLAILLAAVAGLGSSGAVDARGQAVESRAQDGESRVERVEAEVEHAAHTDPTHSSTDADPLSIDPDLALWTLVVFVLLLAVLWKFAWGPIMQSLEGREKSIADHIAQAERNHAEAKLLLAEYEKKLALAASEVREIVEQGRRDAEHVKQQMLTEAKASADAERVRAVRDIESATDQALKSLAERSANLAVELAGKIVGSKLKADDHTRLIQEAMAKFPKSGSSSN